MPCAQARHQAGSTISAILARGNDALGTTLERQILVLGLHTAGRCAVAGILTDKAIQSVESGPKDNQHTLCWCLAGPEPEKLGKKMGVRVGGVALGGIQFYLKKSVNY